MKDYFRICKIYLWLRFETRHHLTEPEQSVGEQALQFLSEVVSFIAEILVPNILQLPGHPQSEPLVTLAVPGQSSALKVRD